MSRSKIRSKVVKAALSDKNVVDMFNGIVGSGEDVANLKVMYPKFCKIRDHIERFGKLLVVLNDSHMLATFPSIKESLTVYLEGFTEDVMENFTVPDIPSYIGEYEEYDKVPLEALAEFAKVYMGAQKCNSVSAAIIACKNLIIYKKFLQDPARLKDKFITKHAGLSLCPLADVPQLNFKQMYIDDRLSPSDKQFILTVLHKMMTIGHDLYEAISMPDMDVSEFVEVIMTSITEVKKHIPRCDQAFQKIIESVDMLKGNFNTYYKDYAASGGNATIIMENFVLDVSKTTKTSPAITAQFRKIVSHYRKLSSQQVMHPKLNSLFKQVDANFQELEKRKKAAEEVPDDEVFSDESDGAPADGAPAESAPPVVTSKTTKHRLKRAKAKARSKAASSALSSAAAAVIDDSSDADVHADEHADADADAQPHVPDFDEPLNEQNIE